MLQRRGFKVTMIDQWGPGNSHSSSGGETRLIRCIYGASPFYTAMANRAYTLWRQIEPELGSKYLFPSGCLWFVDENADDLIDQALPIIENEGLEYEKIDPDTARSRYPEVNTDDLRYIVYEKKTGYLLARAACQAIKELFVREGGEYLLSEVQRPSIKNEKIKGVELSSGEWIEADHYIFACGPWLRVLLSIRLACHKVGIVTF